MIRNIQKAESEKFQYFFIFDRALEYRWAPGKEYTAGNRVRPSKPVGFEFEATVGGQSKSVEPLFEKITAAAQTIQDGSITWTARDVSAASADSISSVTVTADTGITITNELTTGLEFSLIVEGGTKGGVYDVDIAAVISSGEEFRETLRVEITAE